MGRRRRRVIRVVKRKLPKVFSCPRCGMFSVRVDSTVAGSALVTCGSCGLKHTYSVVGGKEPIDIYNQFVDEFMSGKVEA